MGGVEEVEPAAVPDVKSGSFQQQERNVSDECSDPPVCRCSHCTGKQRNTKNFISFSLLHNNKQHCLPNWIFWGDFFYYFFCIIIISCSYNQRLAD